MAYGAFWELDPERSRGFGEGFIPRRDIRDYAIDEGLDFGELFWKVRAMDGEYLKWKQERDEQKRALEESRSKQAHRVNSRRRRA